MRTPFRLLGLFLVAAGISGCVDHLAHQPILGAFLNVFNRFVIPRIDALAGYELFANLIVAVVGAVVLVAASQVRSS
jgi:hypothetical protein